MRFKYEDIYLVLTDTGSENRTLTVEPDSVVNESFKTSEQMMKDLYSSTNTASVQIKDKEVGEWIIQSAGDIHCKVYQGDPTGSSYTHLFTGYFSDKYNWGFTTGGDNVFNLTLEDAGTKAFDRTLCSEDTYYEWSSLSQAITALVTFVNSKVTTAEQITVGTIPSVTCRIARRIPAGESVAKVLKDICFECGCVCYFSGNGSLNALSIAMADFEDEGELDKNTLVAYNGKDVWSVQKNVVQYKDASCTYTTLKDVDDALIYKVTDVSEGYSEVDSGGECKIDVNPNTAFPSMVTIESGSTDSDLKLIQNCEMVLEGEAAGRTILQVKPNTVVPTVVYTGGTLTPETTTNKFIHRVSDLQLYCLAKNLSTTKAVISKFHATGDVIVEYETRKTTSKQELDLVKLYDYECKYIHEEEPAQRLTNLIAQYYQNSNLEYSFYSYEELPLATQVYTIDADPYGLNTKILPYKKEKYRELYKYTAVGVEPFNLEFQGHSSGYVPTSGIIPGSPGTPGEDGKDGAYNEYQFAKNTSPTTAPTTGWQDAPMDVSSGEYLWMRQRRVTF